MKKLAASDITPAIKSAVNAVLMARTLAAVEREKMDKVDRAILECEYLTDKKWEPHVPVHHITDPKELHLMREEDWSDYYAERQKRIDGMGYKLPSGHCPACVAENLQIKAEHILVECAEKLFPGVTVDRILCGPNGLERLKEYLDLLIKLVVNLPDYRNPLTGELVSAAADGRKHGREGNELADA
jgi:hypothetical protein